MNMFLDFDITIFDLVRFMNDLRGVLRTHGVSQELIDAYYSRSNPRIEDTTSKTHYLIQNPDEMGRILETEKVDKIMTAWKEIIASGNKYVFPDALFFLEKYSHENLIVVSYSSPVWQSLKIDISGTRRYFKDIFIVRGPKSVALKDCNEGGPLDGIFVDDRARYIDDIKANFPEIVVFHMLRPIGRYNHERPTVDHVIVSGFGEVDKHIQNHIPQS